MIDRLRTLSRPRRHPRDAVLSQYLEGDIDADGRRSLEDHVGDCARCRQQLASLASAVRALGSLREDTPPGLADSIVAALRAQTPEPAIRPQSRDVAGIPVLTVVPALGNGDGRRNRWPQDARTALRWCLQKPQLRLTVPITLVAGVVLSMVNMGGMLMHGKIDLGVCLSCAVDFIVPFLGLNLALLALVRIPRRRRL